MPPATVFLACFFSFNILSYDVGLSIIFITRDSHRLGVCLSVCHTLICIKTMQARITKFSLWAASRSLVFRDKISCLGFGGSPRTRASKRGFVFPLKRYFDFIGFSSVKTVADRYTYVAYHNKHW